MPAEKQIQISLDDVFKTNEMSEEEKIVRDEVQKSAYLASLDPIILLTKEFVVVDYNQAMLEYLTARFRREIGYDSQDIRLKFLTEKCAINYFSIKTIEGIRKAFETGQSSAYSELILDDSGIATPLILTCKRIFFEGKEPLVAVYFIVLPEGIESVKEVTIQGKLIASMSAIASNLMRAQHDKFDRAIWESLKSLGLAADVDRMYVWENYYKDNKLCCGQIYEWSEGAEAQQGNNLTAYLPYSDVPYWHERLSHGKNISGLVRLLPKEERAVLEPQSIISILVLPVYYAGKWFGFVGFDDCTKERGFSEVDTHVLQSAGMMLISAIVRNRADEQQIKDKESIEENSRLIVLANTAANLLLENVSVNLNDVLIEIMQSLAKEFSADRAYVWRNIMQDGELYGREYVEWAKNKKSFGDEPLLFPYQAFPGDVNEIFEAGFINISGEELQSLLGSFSAADGVKTLLLLPIIVRGEFWGIIGLDYLEISSTFSDFEIGTIRSIGTMLATAIQKEEINENLVEAKEEALIGLRAKSDFLSRMSHEIRTPMNAIIGMTAIAEKAEDQSKIKYCLKKIDLASQQLLSVINDVLDMSKIEANKLDIFKEEFDFEEMLRKVFNVVQVKIYEKKQNFTFELEEVFTRYLVSDELRISQTLINLLNNAVKFTPEHGDISVFIKQTELSENTSMLRFEIKDSGIGIAPENIGKLFQSFEQVDGAITREYGGTGLGLVICKSIVELLNGRIWVESEKGHGTSFIFEIEVSWGAEKRNFKSEQTGKLHILLLDKDEASLNYIANQLYSFQYYVDKAQTVDGAIQLVKDKAKNNKKYDIAFLDSSSLNEEIAATELKNTLQDTAIIAIIQTQAAVTFLENQENAWISHYLIKPILPSSLFDKVSEIVGNILIEGDNKEGLLQYDWRNKKLLLVEDVEINQEIVISILESTNITIDTAINGLEGLKRLEEFNDYDVILMDVQMPIMDGIAATKKIRAHENAKTRSIPILAMTANAFKEDVETCIAAGMNGHISKPVDMEEFFIKLSSILD